MSSNPKIGALVLAAGASTRFGRPKQLAIFRGQPLVRHAIAGAVSAGCNPVVVVLGNHAAEVEAVLPGAACETIINAEWREGMASSIRGGLQHLVTREYDLDAILLLPCDQPLVEATALRNLMRLHRENPKPIVASAYAGTLGIPALFERSYFPALLELHGDRGAKDLILSNPDDVESFALPAAAVDIDTAADYEKLNGA